MENRWYTGGAVVDSKSLASTELYDPVAGTVTAGPLMSAPRSVHTATLLPDGRVLLAGGFTADFSPLASVEIFDPTTDTISAAAAMATARRSHSATLLDDGQVLVVGGFSGTSAFTGAATTAAELFDGTTWTATGSLNEARESQTATRFLDGRVLIAAGQGAFPVLRASAEIYDPLTGAFAFTGSLSIARWSHTATLLPDGAVLIAGGNTDAATGGLTASVEQFDPVSGTFTSVGSLAAARAEHTATLLPDGTILMVGGVAARPERWDPATDGTEPAGLPSVPDRAAHTATVTAAGSVAIIGGFAVIGGFATTGGPIASIELYSPGTEASGFPTTFTVTNLLDDLNPGSLRSAITQANNNLAVADTIDFEAGLTGTIPLATSLPVITDDLTINGPGADLITVDGQLQAGVRPFEVAVGVTALIDGLTITGGNTGAANGGGLLNSGTLTITNATLAGNTALNGGGIANTGGTLLVSNSTLTGNTATGIDFDGGGGLFNTGDLTITHSTLAGNTASRGGGGILNPAGGTLTITHSTLAGNFAGGGGGILNGGALAITHSTISGNTATSIGGGIDNDGGTLTISNSTITGNAAHNFGGGGIGSFRGATVSISNSTITGNFASTLGGGGIFTLDPLTITSTIVAKNTSSTGGVAVGVVIIAPDIVGEVTADFSLIGEDTEATITPGVGGGNNIIGTMATPVDPLFQEDGGGLPLLADNGGPTQTIALLAGSPALDAGSNPDRLATDQRGRGFPREVGQTDIGAFEVRPPPPPPLIDETVTVDGDGKLTATSADGGTTVLVPSGAIPDATSVDVLVTAQDANQLAADGTPIPPGTFLVGGQAFTVTITDAAGNPVTDFAAPITLMFQVDPPATPGVLRVAFFDTDVGEWVLIPAMISATGKVTIEIDHLTLFAVFQAPGIEVTLGAGFTAVTFAGATGAAVADFAATLSDDVEAILRFDAATQRYQVFRPAGPAFVDTLATLTNRDALLVQRSAGASVDVVLSDLLPSLSGERAVALVPGFTSISFTGQDGAAIDELLDGTGVTRAFRWDAASQRWQAFFVGEPTFLNGFATVDRFDLLFLFNPLGEAIELSLPDGNVIPDLPAGV